MNKNVFLLPMYVMLVACSGGSSSPEIAKPISSGEALSAEACNRPIGGSDAYYPLPKEVALSTPFHVRNDRIYPSSNGTTRRRATLEYLDGDLATVADRITEDMEKAGFHLVRRQVGRQGNIFMPFQKPGTKRVVRVFVNPEPGKNSSNPSAKGVMVFDWPTI